MTLNTLLLPTSVETRLGFRLILQYSLIHLLIGNKVFVETKQFSSLFPPRSKLKISSLPGHRFHPAGGPDQSRRDRPEVPGTVVSEQESGRRPSDAILAHCHIG